MMHRKWPTGEIVSRIFCVIIPINSGIRPRDRRLHSPMSRALLISAALLCTLFGGCFDDKPEETIFELVGSKDVRIEAATRILLRKNESLPSALQNAYLLEIKTGDGRIGPSDFRTFCSFEVEPSEVELWVEFLGDPIETPLLVERPGLDRFWWPEREVLAEFTFYPGKSLSGRFNSWAAIDSKAGRIHVYSFTL
jgi:hypothetical protein